MTDLQQIQAIKSQTLALIAEITAQPKPTYKIDGQNVLWTQYLARLHETADWCDGQIEALGPTEIWALLLTRLLSGWPMQAAIFGKCCRATLRARAIRRIRLFPRSREILFI